MSTPALTKNSITEYLTACSERNLPKIKVLLNQHGSSLAKIKGSITPAFMKRKIENNGLHLVIVGKFGELTAMDKSVVEAVSTILQFGCDPNEGDSFGGTPLHVLCSENSVDDEMSSLMCRLVLKGDFKSTMEITSDPTKTDSLTRGVTQTLATNREFKLVIAEKLLSRGAKPSSVDMSGRCPIDLIIDEEFKRKMDALFKKYCPDYVTEGKEAAKKSGADGALCQAIYTDMPKNALEAVGKGASLDMGLKLAISRGRPDVFEALLPLLPAQSPVEIELLICLNLYFSASIFEMLLDRHVDHNHKDETRSFSQILWHDLALRGNVEGITILVKRGVKLEMDTGKGFTILELLKGEGGAFGFLKSVMGPMGETRLSYEIVKIIEAHPELSLRFQREVLQGSILSAIQALEVKGYDLEQAWKIHEELISEETDFEQLSAKLKSTFGQLDYLTSVIEGGNDKNTKIVELLEEAAA